MPFLKQAWKSCFLAKVLVTQCSSIDSEVIHPCPCGLWLPRARSSLRARSSTECSPCPIAWLFTTTMRYGGLLTFYQETETQHSMGIK